MNKREFLKTSGILSAGLALSNAVIAHKISKPLYAPGASEFVLPKLSYAYNALEPYIDAKTMEVHHSKHHAGYTKKFNAALKGSVYEGMDINKIFSNIEKKDLAIRNNGGGYYNHKLFWSIMGPNSGGTPNNEVGTAIIKAFGSFENFKNEFSNAAKTVFGSGWAWLSKNDEGELFISKTSNQDNPLMKKIIDKPATPILCIDVWEHAYYLKYQNLRGDYISNFFNVINWKAVNKLFLG